ncbi:S-layer homology domain-containing protein [Demequina sp. SO4-13]|uniref:S-layer homology domain-containing protein n=1 Tax=Demequina sp. SO4-13 TaxID=3401027 RepID=UPI003AF4644C
MSNSGLSVRVRGIAAATIAVLGMGAAVTLAGPATAATGASLTGTVTMPAGAPAEWLDGVTVSVETDARSYEADVEAETGAYVIEDVPVGNHVVYFSVMSYYDLDTDEWIDPNLVPEYHDDAWFYEDATPVRFDEGASLTIDASLDYGRSITGTVSLDEGADPALLESPIEVAAALMSADEWFERAARVDPETGAYSLTGLTPGDYLVSFSGIADGPGSATNVIREYYDDASFEDTATLVDVRTADVTGIDASLAEGLTVSGTVTLPDGAPQEWLAGIAVSAYDDDGNWYGASNVDPADGTYTVAGLPSGDYTVEFAADGYWDDELGEWVQINLIGEFYDNASWMDEATYVEVTSSVTGIDAELSVGGSISGTVSLPSGSPEEWWNGVGVSVESVDGFYSSYSGLEPDGKYTVWGLPAGEYMVSFEAEGYWDGQTDEWIPTGLMGEYYDDAATYDQATTLAVGAGEGVTGIDASLEPGLTLSGTVAIEDGGDPGLLAEGIAVSVEAPEWEGFGGWGSAIADPVTGEYTISGLAPTSFHVTFTGEEDWDGDGPYSITNVVTEYYDDVLDYWDATLVDLSAGSVTDIDAELAEGYSISGTVTLPEGAPAEEYEAISVTVVHPERDTVQGAWVDPETGAYTVSGLAADEYYVRFEAYEFYDPELDDYVQSNLVAEFYEDAIAIEDATAVSVVDGDRDGIDVALAYGSTVSGTVTLPEGADPMAGEAVWVTLERPDGTGPQFWANADWETGAYVIRGVPDGTYVASFGAEDYWDEASDDYVPSGIATEYYDDVADIEDATDIVVDGDVSGIDAALDFAVDDGAFLADISDDPDSPDFSEFFNEITWLADEGITRGWDNGDGTANFRPFANVTRDAMAAFLYRYAGSPDVDLPDESPFSDVSPETSEFYEEIVWLSQQEITEGWVVGDETEFRPFEKITRDAMAAFLYRFADSPEWTAPEESPFVDVTADNTEFYAEITWLADSGITTGWTVGDETQFRPFSPITRDAMAAFLYRFDQLPE